MSDESADVPTTAQQLAAIQASIRSLTDSTDRLVTIANVVQQRLVEVQGGLAEVQGGLAEVQGRQPGDDTVTLMLNQSVLERSLNELRQSTDDGFRQVMRYACHCVEPQPLRSSRAESESVHVNVNGTEEYRDET